VERTHWGEWGGLRVLAKEKEKTIREKKLFCKTKCRKEQRKGYETAREGKALRNPFDRRIRAGGGKNGSKRAKV